MKSTRFCWLDELDQPDVGFRKKKNRCSQFWNDMGCVQAVILFAQTWYEITLDMQELAL